MWKACGTLWAALLGALIPWGLLAVFLLTIVWVGVVAASNTPPRYKAELDAFEPSEALTTFQTGPLMGWYVYLYVGDERVVCANPKVWDGPKVITCSHVVAIDDEVPQQEADATGPLAAIPPFDAFVPDAPAPGEDPHSQIVLDEIDLIMKRLTWEGRNAERR